MAKHKAEDIDWDRVFRLRCRSKRGEVLNQEEHDYCRKAYKADEKRYATLEPKVFNATVPFGSNVRMKEQ